MTFHSIVEHWCSIYKYMMHSPQNKRFYLTDTKMGVVDLAKDISNKMSPCVVMESTVEGGGTVQRPERNYPIYFFVRAKKMADGDEATVAKETAWMHARNFLSWLLKKREEDKDNRDGDFTRIKMDDDMFMDTVGPLENGWYAVCIQFDREEPLNLCVDEDLYIEDCNC